MSKIAVLADIHGNSLALDAVLEDIDKKDIGVVVNLGDVFYGPLRPEDVFQRIQEREIVSVLGNQDRLILEARPDEIDANPTLKYVTNNLSREAMAWLSALSTTGILLEDIFLCHGSPASDKTYLLEDISLGSSQLRDNQEIQESIEGFHHSLILCGHSHIFRTVTLPNGQQIVNPGSVGLPAYADTWPVEHKMETGSPHACYAVLSSHDHGWQIEQVRVPYPCHLAAAQAEQQNRTDWAYSLKTGRAQLTNFAA
jgi:predicted phosphodiesterase